MNAPIHSRMTEGDVIYRLDAAAAARVRVMLLSQPPREVMAWVVGLNDDHAACKGDVEALLALARRIERGER